MTLLYWSCAAALVIALLGGLVRVVVGPTQPDRMLAAQLFGTVGVATLLLLAFARDDWAIVDVALVLAALAIVTVVAFIRRVRPPREDR